MLQKIELLHQYAPHVSKIRELAKNYYINTPLIESLPLSKLLSKPVYLKMDALQPSGSFKDRGMSHLLSYEHFINNKHEFISSSGGNAGLAAATVSNQMGVSCHVIVPSTTSSVAISRIEQQNAKVTVYGNNWNEADTYARELISANIDNIAYIHPFDHPLLWFGHSTIINEIINDRRHGSSTQIIPDCIVCSVGGGGLFNGLTLGLLDVYEQDTDIANETSIDNNNNSNNHNNNNNNNNVNMDHTTIITSETIGCDSFYQSYNKGEYITLDAITSIANTLGARKVNGNMLEYSKMLKTKPIAEIITDKQAVNAVGRFLDDHRILVEPACAASLALLYEEDKRGVFDKFENVVVEVCGGSGTNMELLSQFCKKFDVQ